MTFEEANKIFKRWQSYQEIADKLGQLFIVVPESFLPYPVEILEEALNIVAKGYFDSGDKKAADNIQESMGRYLTGYYLSSDSNGKLVVKDDKLTDEEVLKKMKQELDFILEHPDLLKAKLENLKVARDSWAEFKNTAPTCPSCGHIANVIDDTTIDS